MWRCENCRKENRDGRKNCWNCSIPQELAVAEGLSNVQKAEAINVVETPTVCAKCSAALDEDSKFCPKCAAPVMFDSTVDCPKCRKTVDAAAKFCKFCAAELTQKEEFRFYSPESSHSEISSFNSPREQAEWLAFAGGGLAMLSGLAFLWGINYASDWSNRARAGFGSLFGQTDSTYQLAQACEVLGAIGFVAGLILFIVAMSQRASNK